MDMFKFIIILIIMANQLHVQSYNMRGFKNSVDYVRILNIIGQNVICNMFARDMAS